MKSHRFHKSTIGIFLAGLLTLTGCAAAEPEPPTPDTASDVETSQKDETTTGGGSVTIPGDVASELPWPDGYTITNVKPSNVDGYVFYMTGTDIEADAETFRTMLLDAGFQQMAWGITDENGANGIFPGDTIAVQLTVHDIGNHIEIIYGYNYRDTD